MACHVGAVLDAHSAAQRYPVKPTIGAREKIVLLDPGSAAGDCGAVYKLGLQPLVRCVRTRTKRGRIEPCIDGIVGPCPGTPAHGVPCSMPVGKGLQTACLGLEDHMAAW